VLELHCFEEWLQLEEEAREMLIGAKYPLFLVHHVDAVNQWVVSRLAKHACF